MPDPFDLKLLFNSGINRRKNKAKLEDLSAYLLIQNLVKFPEYFPITSSSLRFHTLAVILNDIIINERKSIIEFGSGISTLAIANLSKINRLNYTFVSVEDNIGWFNSMKSYLSTYGLEKFVNLVYAPLEKTNLSPENIPWYSIKSLNEQLSRESRFSLVIVDGPGAWKPETEFSRYPALPYLANSLEDSFSIYLDDTDRKGEKRVLSLWQKELGTKFEKINDTASVFVKGQKLNTIP
ncbi:MAG: hypothetical protein HXY48_11305 [Ignavibacteriaceae bacterium]|nr:hypothetical protein [Ignavibacteriaceae bacterium]